MSATWSSLPHWIQEFAVLCDYTKNSLANATRIVDPRLYFLEPVSELITDL